MRERACNSSGQWTPEEPGQLEAAHSNDSSHPCVSWWSAAGTSTCHLCCPGTVQLSWDCAVLGETTMALQARVQTRCVCAGGKQSARGIRYRCLLLLLCAYAIRLGLGAGLKS